MHSNEASATNRNDEDVTEDRTEPEVGVPALENTSVALDDAQATAVSNGVQGASYKTAVKGLRRFSMGQVAGVGTTRFRMTKSLSLGFHRTPEDRVFPFRACERCH